jgi:transposase
MHYSMKRQFEWSGYKVHITETCDDDAAHLVTHVKTCPAMQPDMTRRMSRSMLQIRDERCSP